MSITMLLTHLQLLGKILCHSGTLFSWDLPDLKGKFTQKNILFSDVRFDKIGKNAVDFFFNITSCSQDICIQSGETCDIEAAILICK